MCIGTSNAYQFCQCSRAQHNDERYFEAELHLLYTHNDIVRHSVQFLTQTNSDFKMPCTANYKWENTDKLGEGAFGRVYKVNFLSFDLVFLLAVCIDHFVPSTLSKLDPLLYYLFFLIFEKGTAIKSGEKVAIKTFQYTTDHYIRREAKTMAIANVENVVKFFALEEVKDLLCKQKVLIMEYCAEGNCADLIDSNPNGLTSIEFLHFCHSLVSAIKHLREKDLVHRDVKPSNILISKNNDGQTVYKLADFGAARVLKTNENYGSLYGTYEYVHPDIFAKFYSHALDITPPTQFFNAMHELWSLGITFYQAATGCLPFAPKNGRKNAKTMYEMISQKSNDQISAAETENGRIEWSHELPQDCALEGSLKHDVTSFVAGLLNVSKCFF